MASNRKKPPTPEQLAEAASLRAVFEARLKYSGTTSQEKFAEKYGLGSQGNLSHYLAGRQPLHLEAAIKIAEGLQCDIVDFNPRLAEMLTRGRRNDPRLEQYDIPDHMLHQLLADFQELGRTKRLEFLRGIRAAVVSIQELEKRGMKADYKSDTEIEQALRLNPSRAPTSKPKPVNRKQMRLFGKERPQ